MSNSAALNVHHATSFAFVVGSTKATIAAALITSVRIAVVSVKMILNYVAHGTSSDIYLLLLLRKAQRWTCWQAYVRGASLPSSLDNER
jgi:hypothetical protein